VSVESVLRLARSRADGHARSRADRLADIATDLHRRAPRGGQNLNRYGQPRSAPGEQPAIEEGSLLDALQVPPHAVRERHWRVFVNHAPLEYGAKKNGRIIILPRPMGRLTLDGLKREASG
jgi:hypothetical protein